MANQKTIWIGWNAEQNARSVEIPLEERELWPDAYVSLIVVRPLETQPYLASNISIDDDVMTWIPDGYDTQIAGNGSCVVLYTQDVDGTVILGKSAPFRVVVGNTIPNTEQAEIPDPYESWVATITASAASASQSATDAESAKTDAESARDDAVTAKENAQTAQGLAEDAKDVAVTSAETSGEYATMSESWAIGGTGSRTGEDTDNTKYWAELSQQQAQVAGYVIADVNDDDGNLYITTTNNLANDVDFEVDENTGTLEVNFL